jgi:hypothetical protein
MRWSRPAAMLWALPCSIIGLACAGVLLAAGGKAKWSQGALEVTWRQCNAHCGRFARALRYRGFVAGHIILMVTEEDLARFGAHERVHVAQYERWGPLFLPAYGASSLWQLIRGRRPYWDNHFEIEARERDGSGPQAP